MPTIPPGVPALPMQTPGQRMAAMLNGLGRAFNVRSPARTALPAVTTTSTVSAVTPEQVAAEYQTLTSGLRPDASPYIPGRRPSSPLLGQRAFGPLNPLEPRYGPGTPEGDGGPRQFQYPVGVNILTTPRGEYPNLPPFYQLRGLAEAYDVAAMCIATRIEEVQGMTHSVVALDKRQQTALQDTCDEAEAFFDRPDGVLPFKTWMASLVREHLVTDAVTVFPRLDRGGRLMAAELVSGETIKPLLDDRGRTLAYQQILYGFPFSEYKRPLGAEDDTPNDFPSYSPQELLYMPRFTSTWYPYGSPPSEWIIMRVNQALRKQMFDLSYFTAGNIPEMLAMLPPGAMTPEQVAVFEEAFNALLEGNDAARRKMKFIPWQAQVQELRPFSYETTLDEWMLRVTCAAYAVPPQELGFTEDVNRATAELQEAVNERRGLKPLATWIRDAALNELIHNWMGRTIDRSTAAVSYRDRPTQRVADNNPFRKVGWNWGFGDKQDANTVAQTDEIYMAAKVVSPDEIRTLRFGDELEGPSPATLAVQAAAPLAQSTDQSGGKYGIPVKAVPGAENTPGIGEGKTEHPKETLPTEVNPTTGEEKAANSEFEVIVHDQLLKVVEHWLPRLAKSHTPRREYGYFIKDVQRELFGPLVLGLRDAAYVALPDKFQKAVRAESGLSYAELMRLAEKAALSKRQDAVAYAFDAVQGSLYKGGRPTLDELWGSMLQGVSHLTPMWAAIVYNAPIVTAFNAGFQKSDSGEGRIVMQPPRHIHCRCKLRVRQITPNTAAPRTQLFQPAVASPEDDLDEQSQLEQMAQAGDVRKYGTKAGWQTRRANDTARQQAAGQLGLDWAGETEDAGEESVSKPVWVGVWWTMLDKDVCDTPYNTPWGGTVSGCAGLHNMCVTTGPMLGHIVPV